MSQAAAGSTSCIDASTIAGLLAILLRIPQSSRCTSANELRELLRSDEALRTWAENCWRAADEKRKSDSTLPLEQFLAANLPKLLADRPAWLSTAASNSQANSLATSLVEAANLVQRTQALQNNFGEELNEQFDRAAYNFAYGLSHELNNPLANISTRAGVLLQRAESAEQKQLLTAIVDNAMRGCEMLGDLMLVARPPSLQLDRAPAAPLLSQFADTVAQYAEPRNVAVATHFNDDLPDIEVDATAMQEALWALARNAIEAMPDGGQIDIAARVIETQAIEAAASTKDRDGRDLLHIQISDNGSGLSEQALKSCFDIFYSSREAGRGLGVGMAKAKRIVDLHSGKISIANRPSGGCSVIVLLPV